MVGASSSSSSAIPSTSSAGGAERMVAARSSPDHTTSSVVCDDPGPSTAYLDYDDLLYVTDDSSADSDESDADLQTALRASIRDLDRTPMYVVLLTHSLAFIMFLNSP
jgi:hypothetical protein